MITQFPSLTHLSDADLVAGLKRCLGREREAAAQIVAHLAEVDARQIHLREGFGSMFTYCRSIGLTEHEAYCRIEVARAARRFPVILELLAQGAVHITAVKLLAPT